MRKKSYAENSDEENEFEVDEPEEIQNNATDDEWTPDKDTSGGRRASTRLRNIPKSRAPIIDASSTDEEVSDSEAGGKRKGKGRGRGRQPVKKHKVSSSSPAAPPKSKNDSATKSVSSDSEPSSTTATNNSTSTVIKVNKDFTSGAFIVLKADLDKLEEDPPLWKIDGKALLQKYIPFDQDGKTLYKNTSVYSGWTMNNRDNYFPISVIFKQQTRKEHIVEFNRDLVKREGRDSDGTKADNGNGADNGMDNEEDEDEDDNEDEDDENEDEDDDNEDEENEEEEEEDNDTKNDSKELDDKVKKEPEENESSEEKEDKE